MAEQVEVDINARDNGTPAWKKQADAVHAYLRELAQLDNAQKKNEQSAKRWDKAVAGVANRITSQIAGYVSLQAVIGAVIRSQQEQIKLADEAAAKDDARVRKLRVQAGMGALDTEDARQRVYKTAEKRAFTSDQAFDAATQLISSGFSQEEGTGQSLDEFLKILSASNQSGKDVDATGMAKALSAYLDSQGMDKTSRNVIEVGQRVQRLFKGTNLQLTDLPFLANEGSTLKGKLSTEEQLASFASLVDSKTSGATAAVGLRNFASILSGASGDKTRSAALGKMGLKAGDVDFVGETMGTVLDKLAGGMDSLSPEERSPVLQKLFGMENASTAQSLIEKRGKVQEYIATSNDRAGFEEDLTVSESGRNAALRRQQVRKEMRDSERSGTGELFRGALEEQMDQQGMSPVQRDFRRAGFDMLRYMGLGDETSAKIVAGSDVYNSASSGTGLLPSDTNAATMTNINKTVGQDLGAGTLKDELKHLADVTAKNNEVVQAQNDEAKKPKKFVPATNPRPAAPRPSAQIGGG